MKKWAVLGLFLLCLCSVAVSAEDPGNKTMSINLSPNLDESLYLNTHYTALFKLEITGKKPCSPKDTVTVWYNISKNGSLIKEDSFSKEIGCTTSASTGELTPAETGQYVLCGLIVNSSVAGNYPSPLSCSEFEVLDTSSFSCDISLHLKTNETIFYEHGQSIGFKPELNNKSFPFVIEYWIEDLFGSIVKPKTNTTNTNEKSWKTTIKEEDRVLFVRSVLYPSCTDQNQSDNLAETMFIVVSSNSSNLPVPSLADPSAARNSGINITKITPQESQFGELITVEVEIYKNSTNKYALSTWVEKDGKTISKKTKTNLKTKNMEYQFTLPIQLLPNCDSSIDDGDAFVLVEGLGAEAQGKISLSGNDADLCDETTKDPTKAKEAKELKSTFVPTHKILEVPASIAPGQVFPVKIELVNGNTDYEFTVWSYLYRGSKCYSCSNGVEDRDSNLKSFTLAAGERKEAEVMVTADPDLKGGDYNLKIKIQKGNQKTTKDFTAAISVMLEKQEASSQSASFDLLSESSTTLAQTLEQTSFAERERVFNSNGIIVYESNSEKAKRLIPIFLALGFGLLNLLFVWKKY